MTPLLYFVRHGQTDWNAEGQIQGHIEVPINAKGRSQAARNADVLRELLNDPPSFDFLASPMLRTRQTMDILLEGLALPAGAYRTDDRLKEISFGDWGGRSMTNIRAQEPDAYAARAQDLWCWTPPGGESYETVFDRVRACIAEIAHPTVIVAHGGVMRCLRGHILNLDRKDIPFLDVPQDKVLMIEGGRLTWF